MSSQDNNNQAPSVFGRSATRAEHSLPDRVAYIEDGWRSINRSLNDHDDDIKELRAMIENRHKPRIDLDLTVTRQPLREIAALASNLNYGDMLELAEAIVKDLAVDNVAADRVASILFKWSKKKSGDQ